MKLGLFISLAIAGTVGAFQPASKVSVPKNKFVSSQDGYVRSTGTPLTKADMVAIRTPFWNIFDGGIDTTRSLNNNIDYVVDRDYTVALTLLCVGIGLALFHPSKFTYKLSCCFASHVLTYTSLLCIAIGDYMFIDMLGAAFHLWFGSFIGMQTMKTRAVFNKVGGHSCAKDCHSCYSYDITLTIPSSL